MASRRFFGVVLVLALRPWPIATQGSWRILVVGGMRTATSHAQSRRPQARARAADAIRARPQVTGTTEALSANRCATGSAEPPESNHGGCGTSAGYARRRRCAGAYKMGTHTDQTSDHLAKTAQNRRLPNAVCKSCVKAAEIRCAPKTKKDRPAVHLDCLPKAAGDAHLGGHPARHDGL